MKIWEAISNPETMPEWDTSTKPAEVLSRDGNTVMMTHTTVMEGTETAIKEKWTRARPVMPRNLLTSHRTTPAPRHEDTVLHQRPLTHQSNKPLNVCPEPRIRLARKIVQY